MNDLDAVIAKMDFEYFGTGQHKIDPAAFFDCDNAVLLDVRAQEELDTIRLPLKHHLPVLEIPTNQVPARIGEIPKDKLIGVFCSSGVRCTVIFTYLKSKGYPNVKILPHGYVPLIEALMPGKIHKKIKG
jgi:rhodanese-related sulfurtransferase